MQVILVCNHIGEVVSRVRGIPRCYPAERMRRELIDALHYAGCHVSILSAGAGKSVKRKIYFKKMNENFGKIPVEYAPWLNCFGLRTLSRITGMTFLLWRMLSKARQCVVIYTNNYVITAVPTMLCRLFRRVGILLDLRDVLEYDANVRGIKRFVSKILSRISQHVIDGAIVLSPSMLDKVVTRNIFVFRGVVSKEPRRISEKIPKKFHIVYGGRLDEQRGARLFASMIRWLDSQQVNLQNVVFHVTGAGPLANEIEKAFRDARHLKGHFHGLLSLREYHSILSISHIGICPQLATDPFSKGSFPSKLLEYMQEGLLVISSKVSDVDSISNDAGIITYEEDTPASLGQAILMVIKEWPRFAKRAVQSRNWLYKNCSLENVSQSLTNILKKSTC